MSTVVCDRLGPMVPLMSQSPSQWIAESGLILRTQVGSGVLGTSVSGQDDRDEMGVCIEPPDHVMGLRTFSHYEYRTQPQGVCSGPGDLDQITYSLRRYVGLATQGNPTVLTPLFVPETEVLLPDRDRRGAAQAPGAVPLEACRRPVPRVSRIPEEGLLGLRSGGSRNQGRADLRAKYGFDTKFAMHMVRLGIQGVELLRTGRITLPVPEPELTWLRALRRGEHTKEEALDRAVELEAEIDRLMAVPGPLPDEPDRRAIDAWLVSAHRQHWGWDA